MNFDRLLLLFAMPLGVHSLRTVLQFKKNKKQLVDWQLECKTSKVNGVKFLLYKLLSLSSPLLVVWQNIYILLSQIKYKLESAEHISNKILREALQIFSILDKKEKLKHLMKNVCVCV